MYVCNQANERMNEEVWIILMWMMFSAVLLHISRAAAELSHPTEDEDMLIYPISHPGVCHSLSENVIVCVWTL